MNIAWGNGLAPKGAHPVYWCIYVPLGGDELTRILQGYFPETRILSHDTIVLAPVKLSQKWRIWEI